MARRLKQDWTAPTTRALEIGQIARQTFCKGDVYFTASAKVILTSMKIPVSLYCRVAVFDESLHIKWVVS